MLSWIDENRPLVLVALFLAFNLVELWWPACRQRLSLLGRWFTNISLYAVNTTLSVGLHLLPGLWLANWATNNQYGLFGLFDAPFWLVVVAGIVAIDLKNYLLHRAMHHFPLLWRIHKVHHSDIEVDVTTAFRFHPGEALITISLHLLIVLALGLPAEMVVVYWLVVNLSNLFSHSNVFIPERLDRQLQRGVITASAHRLHHSIDLDDSNHNFGSILVFWDKWFGTYKSGTGDRQRDREFGLPEYRDARGVLLPQVLMMPMLPGPSTDPIVLPLKGGIAACDRARPSCRPKNFGTILVRALKSSP